MKQDQGRIYVRLYLSALFFGITSVTNPPLLYYITIYIHCCLFDVLVNVECLGSYIDIFASQKLRA